MLSVFRALFGVGIFSLLSFSAYASEVQVKINSQAIIRDYLERAISDLKSVSQSLDLANAADRQKIQAAISDIQKWKNVNFYKPLSLVGKSNLYWIGGSLIVGYAIDKLIDKLNSSYNLQVSSIPPLPPDGLCKYNYLSPRQDVYFDYAGRYTGWSKYTVPGDSGLSCYENRLVGWRCTSDGYLMPVYSYTNTILHYKKGDVVNLAGSRCVDVLPDEVAPSSPDTQPQRKPVPFIIPADILDSSISSANVPQTIDTSVSLPDTVKKLSDIENNQPFLSPDNQVKIDYPQAPGDGNLSDSPSPNNPVVDVADNKGNIQVVYNINNNTYNEYNTTNTTNTTNKEDYTFTSPDASFDTKMDVPQKKDLKSLVLSVQSQIKNFILRFFQGVQLNSAQCSFSIQTPFNTTAVLDFCQYESIVDMIGGIVLAFSYIYAFYIIFRVD